MLHSFDTIALTEIAHNSLRVIQYGRFLAFLGLHSPCEREGCDERGGFVRAHPGFALQIIDGGLCNGMQRTVFLEQPPANLYDVGAFQSGAEQNGDQFGVSQRVRAARLEPLARAFADRLILEPQSLGHAAFLNLGGHEGEENVWKSEISPLNAVRCRRVYLMAG